MMLFKYASSSFPLLQHAGRQFMSCFPCQPSCGCKPQHLICFKQWTAQMVLDVIMSAINLKNLHCNTHSLRLSNLSNAKVMILQEVNVPHLSMAVSKAATLLGAYDVNVTDKLVWDYDYMGRIFSSMADVIFVSTTTHMCVQRFADQSTVPVLCMSSRTHGSIQSLATVMAIIEEFGTMCSLNISWLGPCHPVLNSYLLLCPMLGANIRYKCCCKDCPVSPLLMKSSEEMTEKSSTVSEKCSSVTDILKNTNVVIAGPTVTKKEKLPEFTVTYQEIAKSTSGHWIFFHTCPRGPEVDDNLFYYCNSRTFNAYENLHYIAAALMAYTVKGYSFCL